MSTSLQQRRAAALTMPVHTFSLVFKGVEGSSVAILELFGVTDLDNARYLASTVLPDCTYEVKDGDRSADFFGGAFCTYSYTWTGGELAQA